MFILFDTNVVIDEKHLRSDKIQKIFKHLKRLGLCLIFSYTVIEESAQKWYEMLENKLVSKEEIKKEVEKYKSELVKILHISKIQNCRVASNNYPNHIFWKRSIIKEKPFAKGGKGYKDAVIWEELKAIARTYCNDKSKIAFITNNIRDFSDGQKIPDQKWFYPTEYMINEIIPYGCFRDSIRIYEKVEDFNAAVINRENAK